jgi:hypothetical protein
MCEIVVNSLAHNYYDIEVAVNIISIESLSASMFH